MRKRYIIAASLAILSLALVVWPPVDAKSQSDTENVKPIEERKAETIREGDSLRHAIKVEFDLMKYKNQADTL